MREMKEENMAETLPFYICDVFAEAKYSGNQLATFLNASALSDDEMQQIAREIHFSETTFILSGRPREGGYDVRIFTPGAEVDFAGHPTLGTAYIIHEYLMDTLTNRVVLNLKVGQVPVDFADDASDGRLWMEQMEPEFGRVLESAQVAPVLGLDEQDIDGRWPIEEVSTGLPHIIVPLRDLKTLKRVRIRRDAYDSLVSDAWAKVILVFCQGGYTDAQHLGVRVFPIHYGIPEDPATGSGNGCLAAFLVKHRVLQSGAIDVAAGQGYEIGRPSTLYLRAGSVEERIYVSVGGRVQHVAEGRWG